ncbi:MAG TPA: hypothetical protein VGL88_00175 [Pseudonocardiaceae bacterium]|jgi:hypothetical protein
MDFGVGAGRVDRPVEVQMLAVRPRGAVERALDRWAGAISEFTGG